MKRFLYLNFIIWVSVFSAYATFPATYYNSTEGKKAAQLKTELHNIICQDTTHYLGYGSGKGYTWEGFYSTDRNLTTNAVIDMYSDSVRYFPNPNPTFVSFGQTIHIEHSVPKSWWGCDINHPDCPAKDLNHLYPADGPTNSSKNDNPLGKVTGTPTYNNGVSKIGPGSYVGYTGAVFEPADQYKGDFARSYFYIATAYEHYKNKWDITKPENMMEKNTYPVFKPWAIELLLQWHRQDPVSLKEVTRNEQVYAIQKNRNPFIDYPKLVEYIWGTRTTIPFRLDVNIIFPYLNWPNDNDTINVGKVYYNQTKDTTISLQAMNLTGDLSLSIGGVNSSLFSVDKTTISKAEAETGCVILLHYRALEVGDKSAILTIYGGGITPVSLKLKTTTTDEFAALPPTNTTNSGFVADWTPSSGATGYSLNVFTIENTGTNPTTLLEEDFTLTLPNSWLREGYTDNSLGGNIKLGTASTFGKITTPALDLSKSTSTLTVRAKQFSNDAGAKITATLDNQPLAVFTTAVANQDFTVDMPISTAVSKIALSTISGKRVYIDYLKVVEQIPVYGPVSIAGYPKTVGNVLNYLVTGLQSGSKYYYTVTPIGNGGSVSNQVVVQTNINTTVDQLQNNMIRWTYLPHGINVQNLTIGSKLILMDAMGRKIKSIQTTSSEITIELPQKGIYLLQIQNHLNFQTFKILH
jgi:hypothetical protein